MTNQQPRKYGVIELFAGAGGLAAGFAASGKYDVIALSDIDQNAQKTYLCNYPDAHYIQSDITDLKVQALHQAADGREIHGLLGGPPCQGFSLAGKKNRNDERNKFITKYAEFVNALKPTFLLMENVPQVMFHERFVQLIEQLQSEYIVCFTVLNAARYGVPQTRHRAFVLAFRRETALRPTFPAPTHGFLDRDVYNYRTNRLQSPCPNKVGERDILGADPITRRTIVPCAHGDLYGAASSPFSAPVEKQKPLVNVWEAISDLVNVDGSCQILPSGLPSEYQARLRDSAERLFNHRIRTHDNRMQKIMSLIREGQDLRVVHDASLRPKSHYSQAYGRLHRLGLARTVTTYFCNPGSGRFLHPTLDRAITVREAARLQSFSDTFEFLGTQSEQMRLVGNAVPPVLAQTLAKHIADTLSADGP